MKFVDEHNALFQVPDKMIGYDCLSRNSFLSNVQCRVCDNNNGYFVRWRMIKTVYMYAYEQTMTEGRERTQIRPTTPRWTNRMMYRDVHTHCRQSWLNPQGLAPARGLRPTWLYDMYTNTQTQYSLLCFIAELPVSCAICDRFLKRADFCYYSSENSLHAFPSKN